LPVDFALFEAKGGRLILEADLIAHDGNCEALRRVCLPEDCELYGRSLLAANQAHRVAQGHVDDVHRCVIALADFDDLILRFEDVDFVRGASRNDSFDDREAIALRKRHADADQRK